MASTIFTLNPAYMIEGTGSTGSIWRSNDTTKAESLVLYSKNGTALGGVDFAATPIYVNFEPGQAAASYTVQSFDDTQYEGNESFSLGLYRSAGGPELATTTITIADNEVALDPVDFVPSAPVNRPNVPVTPQNSQVPGFNVSGNTFNSGISNSYNTTNVTNNFINNLNSNSNNSNSFNPVTTNSGNSGSFNTNSNNTTQNWLIDNSVRTGDIVRQYLPAVINASTLKALEQPVTAKVNASSWSADVLVKEVGQGGTAGGDLIANQIDFSNPAPQAAVLNGGSANDSIWGKAGWDRLDGGAGNDLIRAGNGRDIITGGLGTDELHGDFGWNTYTSERDGFQDLIVVKSDQWLENWIYGKAGNNPNGEKADVIEGLDASDKIRIVGVSTDQLTFGITQAHGMQGIGIFANGSLEALYTGKDLSQSQIASMTTAQLQPTV